MHRTTITLSGSTRFKETFDKINHDLSLQGYVVHSLGVWDHYPDTDIARNNILCDVHFSKIDQSDILIVVNRGVFPADILYGIYTGVSTNKEIAYAKIHQKTIIFLSSWTREGNFMVDDFVLAFPPVTQ